LGLAWNFLLARPLKRHPWGTMQWHPWTGSLFAVDGIMTLGNDTHITKKIRRRGRQRPPRTKARENLHASRRAAPHLVIGRLSSSSRTKAPQYHLFFNSHLTILFDVGFCSRLWYVFFSVAKWREAQKVESAALLNLLFFSFFFPLRMRDL